MCNFSGWRLFRCLKKPGRKEQEKKRIDREMIQQAGAELSQAYQVLSRVEDNDMVDYAVFTLQAAEKRYGYLLKKLKEEEKQNRTFMEEQVKVKSLYELRGE